MSTWAEGQTQTQRWAKTSFHSLVRAPYDVKINVYHVTFMQVSSYKAVLDHISKCRGICKQLGISSSAGDPTPSLLALYEFEAKLELHHSDIDSSLSQLSSLPGVDTKTLETVAALCVRCSQPGLAVQALRLAIQQHLRAGDLDGEKLRCTAQFSTDSIGLCLWRIVCAAMLVIQFSDG